VSLGAGERKTNTAKELEKTLPLNAICLKPDDIRPGVPDADDRG